jgi:Type IV secretion-system coupling protein DNA-binding domain
MTPHSEQSVIVERRNFSLSTAICVVTLIAVHCVPRSSDFADTRRLFLTTLYFSAATMLGWLLLLPRRTYMQSLYAWRYADAPKPVERAWREYLFALDQVLNPLVIMVLLFMSSIALMVYASWFPIIGALQWLYRPLWWISFGCLLGFPLFGGFLFSELAQRYRALVGQLETGHYQPKPIGWGLKRSDDSGSLAVRSEGGFQAGGIHWQWQDFTRNLIIFGMPGVGKTNCVLNALLEGIIAAGESARSQPSGLILDPKGDFHGKLASLLRRHDRLQDLVVIDPHDPKRTIRWNPLDSKDDELELAKRFVSVMETLGMESGDDSFWIDVASRFLQHSIFLLRATNSQDSVPSLKQIHRLLTSFSNIANRTDRLDPSDPRNEPCLTFFHEWVHMPSRQRSGVYTHLSNMLDPFLLEPYASTFSGNSTIRIDQMLRDGKILYVHMPKAEKEAMAAAVGTFVKLDYYREVLRSLRKDRPSFFLCDEFQQYFTFGKNCSDAAFFAQSRESNHANIVATHNIPGLARLSTTREPVTSLLGLCATKLFLRNSDDETNEYASQLFGEEMMAVGGVAGGQGWKGGAARTVNQHDQLMRRVTKDVFQELAVLDQEHQSRHCEAMIYRGARMADVRSVRRSRWPLHLLMSE